MGVRDVAFDERHPVICPVCSAEVVPWPSDYEEFGLCPHVMAWYNDFDNGGWLHIQPWLKRKIGCFEDGRGARALVRMFRRNSSVDVCRFPYHLEDDVTTTMTLAFSVGGCLFATHERRSGRGV
jgi:hypothetical protein